MSSRILTTAALLVLSLCMALAADEGPFVSLSLEEACKRAAAENKLVVVNFYANWCAPCKHMNETTFADQGVIAWLKEHAVAIMVDVDQERKLADDRSVLEMPTLLLVNPAGRELGRISDAVDAKVFLEEASAIRAGKSPLERAADRLAAAGDSDPVARMRYADELVRLGKSAEGLKEYLWCFDEGAKHSPSFDGKRLSYLLTRLLRLGESDPVVLDELRRRRDAARREIESYEPGKQSPSTLNWMKLNRALSDYAALNKALAEEVRTLELYDELRHEDPDCPVVLQLRRELFDSLRRARRYVEIADSNEALWGTAERAGRTGQIDEIFLNQTPQARQKLLLDCTVKYYEVLIGIGDIEAAEQLANRALAIDSSAQTYNMLAWYGYLSGKPTEANLAQARKAHELSEGKEAAIIDTLARVLHALDKKDEACEVLRTSGKNVTSQGDRMALLETMADLECQDTLIE